MAFRFLHIAPETANSQCNLRLLPSPSRHRGTTLAFAIPVRPLASIEPSYRPWHRLYLEPEPHGHGSSRPTFAFAFGRGARLEARSARSSRASSWASQCRSRSVRVRRCSSARLTALSRASTCASRVVSRSSALAANIGTSSTVDSPNTPRSSLSMSVTIALPIEIPTMSQYRLQVDHFAGGTGTLTIWKASASSRPASSLRSILAKMPRSRSITGLRVSTCIHAATCCTCVCDLVVAVRDRDLDGGVRVVVWIAAVVGRGRGIAVLF